MSMKYIDQMGQNFLSDVSRYDLTILLCSVDHTNTSSILGTYAILLQSLGKEEVVIL